MLNNYEGKIRKEAIACYPEEGVWLITSKGCRQVKNTHKDPNNFFKVGLKDLCKAERDGLLAVVHSHPDKPDVPSAADMQSQINTAVPWGILTCSSEASGRIRWWGLPTDRPLIGRSFSHGINDCYSLVKDYYKQEMGIELPEFPRDWDWWNKGQDLLMEGFSKANFKEIPKCEVKPGDAWLAKIRGGVVHHCGVYIGHGLMIHQMGHAGKCVDESKLSAREPIVRYEKFICKWLRYVG